jgi:hypothetical protein
LNWKRYRESGHTTACRSLHLWISGNSGDTILVGVHFPLGPGFCLRSVRPALSSLSTKRKEARDLPVVSCRRSSRVSSAPHFVSHSPIELDVSPVVIVAEEGLLAAVASSRELMGQPCCHRSCDFGHDQFLVCVRPLALIDTYVVPGIPTFAIFPRCGIASLLSQGRPSYQ